jgi:uncharacterized membrane protein YkvA (DUF1232 family)
MDDRQYIEPITDAEGVTPARRWQETGREIVLMLPNLAKLLARIVRDPRVPVRHKTFAAAVFVYVLSPIDLIPDMIPGLGRFDDVLFVAIALNHLIEGAGRSVITEHWDGSEDSLDLVLSVADWGAEVIPGPFRRLLP